MLVGLLRRCVSEIRDGLRAVLSTKSLIYSVGVLQLAGRFIRLTVGCFLLRLTFELLPTVPLAEQDCSKP
jgi:hypothetical protein